jgi:hypothetical protein
VTFGDQEQVGKPVQICVAWARQDRLGGREGRVEDVEFRVTLQKISDGNGHVILDSIIIRCGVEGFDEDALGLKKKTRSEGRRRTVPRDCDTVPQRRDHLLGGMQRMRHIMGAVYYKQCSVHS